MMDIYLFATCRGKFNLNKVMRKSVQLVGHSHVYVPLRAIEHSHVTNELLAEQKRCTLIIKMHVAPLIP
jgi:hypothetical protein